MPPKTGNNTTATKGRKASVKSTGSKTATSKAATGKTTTGSKTATARAKAGKSTTARKRSGVPSADGKRLVIVESPAKARTVGQILGRNYVVAASMGHVRDLPKSTLGVDTEQDFTPKYVTMRDKQTLVTDLKRSAAKASEIYLATDPDREGEAISWHLQHAAGWDEGDRQPKRVVFHEITKEAVEEAFEHPREIDMQLVNAQQARRIVDRLVGYEISPLLWRRVQRGLSAGRVQSVSLRMIVDREREITAFVPEEWWTLEADLHKSEDTSDQPEMFTATLHSRQGARRRLSIPSEDAARALETELQDAAYSVQSVEQKPRRQRPSAPFTTSTLQQDSGRKLRFTAQRTMAVAQQLYEGLNIGAEGSVGLITYMRTDSTNVAESAVRETRDFIGDRYGKQYLPDKPRVFRTRSKNAQEAHEAIRPTSVRRDPASLAAHLDRDQLRLYTLIWERMVASQMADAVFEATTVEIEARCKAPSDAAFRFRATGSVLRFPGFRAVYLEGRDDAGDGEENALPALTAGDGLTNQKLAANQHFTQPPPRYTEAALVRAMEEKGIGRPSTYAPTIATLIEREYVEREQTRLSPTHIGFTVTDLLTEHFTDIMDLDFTARMEEDLDDVAQGEREWVPVLREFYSPFHQAVDKALESFAKAEQTDEVCEKCGEPMAIKTGRFGRFMACTGYPKCRNTKDMGDNPDRPFEEESDEICEKCERSMVVKTGRYGRFLACTGYNAEENPCENRRNLVVKSGVPCPKCGGDLVERRSRKSRRSFWGCANYPECDYLVNTRPLPQPCPVCAGMLVTAARGQAACADKACKWKGDPPAVAEPEPSDAVELAPVGS
jgi:DNA topoisomerase-1